MRGAEFSVICSLYFFVIGVTKLKLLFVFTGGTIGSSINNGYISVKDDKPYLLIEAYRKAFGIDFDYDIIKPYAELSENNTGETLKSLIAALKPYVNSSYSGIIVTHGTDTLQYTAAALSYTLDMSVPLCIVSSNYPIEDSRANGLINLAAAVKFIKNVALAGVWVCYQNLGEAPKIHRGSRLIAGQAFSDNLYSVQNSYSYELKKDEFKENLGLYEVKNEIPFFVGDKLSSTSKEILRIESYPGMVYPSVFGDIKYILMGSYHSGTINTKSYEASEFFHKAADKGIKIFLTGVLDGEQYESSKMFDELGIISIKNISPVSAYIKLWLSITEKLKAENLMKKALSGDIIAK